MKKSQNLFTNHVPFLPVFNYLSVFLGYLGAIGAFLKGAEAVDTASYAWTENLYGSSSFRAGSWPHRDRDSSLEVDHLEIDRYT